jgi:hypothetical protein
MTHSHGVHCLHILGWNLRRWCRGCYRHWEESCGKVGCKNYEQTADHDLARAVVLDMQDGRLDIPAEIVELNTPEVPGPWWQL